MDRLVGVCVLGVLYIESGFGQLLRLLYYNLACVEWNVLDSPEEITKLCSGIDLGLVGVLSLAHHRCCHNVVTVLCADQVGGLQENCCAVGKGQALP